MTTAELADARDEVRSAPAPQPRMTTARPAGRVVMFVFNNFTHDSRVLREAQTLAAAGHQVTVIAKGASHRTPPLPAREVRGGVEIVRVDVPTGRKEQWWRFLSAPWSLRRRSVGRLMTQVRTRHLDLAAAAPAGLQLALSLAASAFRRMALARERLTGGRPRGRRAPWPPSPARWLHDWRAPVIGWAEVAADVAPGARVYHGHDLTGLAAAVIAQRRHGGRVVYDSHEIFVDSGSNALRPWWQRSIFALMELSWSRRASALVTVNRSLAIVLRRRYRMKRTVVLHNCAEIVDERASRLDLIRARTGLAPGLAIVLYHGGVTYHRGVEELVAAIADVPDAALVIMGYGPLVEPIRDAVARSPHADRIRILPAVPPDEVLKWVASADVVAMPIQPSTLNHRLSTPNKLFEAIAAGVPVLASDFPQMRRIVMDDPGGPLGAICDPTDPAAIASGLNALLGDRAELERMRQRCRAAAARRWNWKAESKALLELYADLAA